jgi:hypothetical protein
MHRIFPLLRKKCEAIAPPTPPLTKPARMLTSSIVAGSEPCIWGDRALVVGVDLIYVGREDRNGKLSTAPSQSLGVFLLKESLPRFV